MRIVSSLAIFAVICTGFAQQGDQGDFKKKVPKNLKASSAPVTHAEAKATFDKAWNAIAKGLKLKGANPVRLPADSRPVNKDEVLGAIKAVVTQVRPYFKRSATPARYYPSRLRKDFDQGAFSKLIQDGFVMPVGPLVIGQNGPLSTYEFGDAVGVVLIRIADLVHLPSRKFSPALMKGD